MKPSAIPPIAIRRESGDSDARMIQALEDMRSFDRLWVDGNPVDPGLFQIPRSAVPHRPLAAVRMRNLTVSLDEGDEGRALCVRRDGKARYRLFAPSNANRMADTGDPQVEMNGLLRFWAAVPEAVASDPTTGSQNRFDALIDGLAHVLGAAASTAGIDYAPGRTVIIVLPTPWNPAGASSFGEFTKPAPGIILWHRRLLEAAEMAMGALPCLSLTRMVRQEGLDQGRVSTSESIDRIVLSPFSASAQLPACGPMEMLRTLSRLRNLPDAPLARLNKISEVGTCPDYPEPIDR